MIDTAREREKDLNNLIDECGLRSAIFSFKYRVSIFEFRERESCRDVDDNFRTRKSERETFPLLQPSSSSS